MFCRPIAGNTVAMPLGLYLTSISLSRTRSGPRFSQNIGRAQGCGRAIPCSNPKQENLVPKHKVFSKKHPFLQLGNTWHLIPRCQENASKHFNIQIFLGPPPIGLHTLSALAMWGHPLLPKILDPPLDLKKGWHYVRHVIERQMESVYYPRFVLGHLVAARLNIHLLVRNPNAMHTFINLIPWRPWKPFRRFVVLFWTRRTVMPMLNARSRRSMMMLTVINTWTNTNHAEREYEHGDYHYEMCSQGGLRSNISSGCTIANKSWNTWQVPNLR
jgi:hypothetical protein